jgi:EmrB/QacA subfamily drug resistance transporter
MDPAKRRIALLVAACLFMEITDGSVVNTSAPRIASTLGVPTSSIALVITAYIVTVSSLIPLSGWMSARFGARRIFLLAIGLFTLASVGCAASTSVPQLVAARVLQGAGGAMMVPVGRLVVIGDSDRESLLTATAYMVWPALVAPIVAPIIGGTLTTYLSWHWIFLVNVPLGAVALLVSYRIIHPAAQEPPGRLDSLGVLLTCASLAMLTVTADQLARRQIDWPLTLALGVTGTVLLVLNACHLWYSDRPLINLRVLRIKTLRQATWGTAMIFWVIGAGPYLAPLKFELQFAWSPVKAGAMLLFMWAGNIGVKPIANRIFRAYGFRTVIFITAVGLAASSVALGLSTAHTSLVLIGLEMFVWGTTMSSAASGITPMSFADVDEGQMRDATVLQSTVTQLSVGFGVAGSAVALRIGRALSHPLSTSPHASFPYTFGWIMVALFSLMVAVCALGLHPEAGDALRGRRPSP